ncbi:spore germination protein [Paenibacillus physcomitrellae]|uniref:Spore germination protein n=1 Tax=Paenibacillus physcomitrellae TaxID=1619311 RepID=A0ABQ1FQ60_9BACL|nr:spore germination protein [Paenibacillus physcomitrellae]GGA25523.1 spore germination protein [Paenibacillus physcomitrellae]
MTTPKPLDLDQFLQNCSRSSDFLTVPLTFLPSGFTFLYYKTLIDGDKLTQLLQGLQEAARDQAIEKLEDLVNILSSDEIEMTKDSARVQEALLKGYLLIRQEAEPRFALVPIPGKKGMRTNNETDIEFSVIGPKVGFVEDLETNLHLVRAQLCTPDLIVKELTIGSVSKSRIVMMYMEGIANPENVAKMTKRLSAIDFDIVFDTSQLDQLISDNSFTPFPLFTTTERRDRVVYALSQGQVAVISEGSPYFITGPSSLFDFFISPEDYYMPWLLGSFFRVIRIFGVIFSLFATALYVAFTTYHYEVIPKELLNRIIHSRQSVPFPPVIEVLFLEATVEFLREAGARLPSRIGQTLGIVGGVVLGQAAVEAAFTSNILIIIVSLSALTSFVTPIYKMSNAIRFLRFPIIILASLWGSLGIVICLIFLLIHLSRLRSLGYPYTVPLFPLRVKDLRDSFIRSSYAYINKRPSYVKPVSSQRYKVRKRKPTTDFDEE